MRIQKILVHLTLEDATGVTLSVRARCRLAGMQWRNPVAREGVASFGARPFGSAQGDRIENECLSQSA
jgi:hypothetical protein